MSEAFNYGSIFAPYFRDFVKMKQDLGHQALRTKWILLEFDRFFTDIGAEDLYITGELIEQWRGTRINDGQRTIYTKYSVWSQFSKYMCNLGRECYIPRLPKAVARNSFTPYIFSHKEIGDIFRACDSLRLYDNRMSTILFVVPAVVRLLYGTGIRVSEALSLKNGDIDLKNDCITLRRTKMGKNGLRPCPARCGRSLKDTLRKGTGCRYPKRMAPIAIFLSPRTVPFAAREPFIVGSARCSQNAGYSISGTITGHGSMICAILLRSTR